MSSCGNLCGKTIPADTFGIGYIYISRFICHLDQIYKSKAPPTMLKTFQLK